MSELNQKEVDAIISYWQSKATQAEQRSLMLEIAIARLNAEKETPVVDVPLDEVVDVPLDEVE